MRLLIFGLGYSASRIADAVIAEGGVVAGTTRDGRGDTIPFDNTGAVAGWIAEATHILSSVPPGDGPDPVLAAYGEALANATAKLAYLSSTGVYGDVGGGWVDEASPTGSGRRKARSQADAVWLARAARVFRLPGIYGHGRSALDRVASGKAHRVDLPDQVFSRIHVDDLAAGVVAGLDAAAGAYNLADDLPASHDAVMDYAAALLGVASPPVVDVATLSPMAQGFYAENRRVANAKAKRVLGWRPRYRDYRAGLRALNATTSPDMASTAPASA